MKNYKNRFSHNPTNVITIFCSLDGTVDGEPLRYGQSFYISTMDDEGGNVSATEFMSRDARKPVFGVSDQV